LRHYRQNLDESKITAMTGFLLFVAFIVLLILAWAPAHSRAVRSGLYYSTDPVRDSDRRRVLHDLDVL
jgi:hypothetical protein